ncbi:MAG: hypothetical protein OEX18_14610 [Candidatus Krumholzibacteria bacterium]|nr:hypothetical protein [Candidatus Krumholzibacteria bacterium]MDH4338501.1 hypothetical protein [Candidatus Krumholzibacteria bacterium]MDH5270714.1 hypothetical protein [Candidatus Krumholzibacteria bacterium]
MKRLCLFGAMALAVGLYATPTLAGYLIIQTDPNLDYASAKCLNSAAEVDVYFIYVPQPGDPAVRWIQFAAPTPTGCVSIGSRKDIPVLTKSGDSSVDILVDLGCSPVTTHLLTVRLSNVVVSGDCCGWRPLNTHGGTSIDAWDCDGNLVLLQSRGVWFSTQPCAFVAPHTPSPADGETIGALETDLEWQSAGGPECGLGDVLIHNLYFGTDPDALIEHVDAGSPYPVSNLLPGTTYYWRAEATTYNNAGPYPGPLWSFSTPQATGTEQTTWGRIKSLFR